MALLRSPLARAVQAALLGPLAGQVASPPCLPLVAAHLPATQVVAAAHIRVALRRPVRSTQLPLVAALGLAATAVTALGTSELMVASVGLVSLQPLLGRLLPLAAAEAVVVALALAEIHGGAAMAALRHPVAVLAALPTPLGLLALQTRAAAAVVVVASSAGLPPVVLVDPALSLSLTGSDDHMTIKMTAPVVPVWKADR